MGAFLIFIKLAMIGPLTSNVLAKVASGIFAFVLHRSFTFDLRGGKHGRQALQYSILLLINIPLTSVVLALTINLIPYVVVAKFLSDVTCLALTYSVCKKYIFVDKVTKTSRLAEK